MPALNSVSITIAPGEDTLDKVRDKINAAGAGVTASIVNDASGARLAIRSRETGEENGFRINVADDDGNGGDAAGLSMLAFNPLRRCESDDAGTGGRERRADDQQHPDQLRQQHAHRRARRPDGARLARDRPVPWTWA